MALLLADQGDAERAIEIYALASHDPYVANSRWYEDVVGKHIAAAATTLPPEVVAAAHERGRERDLWETAADLLVELVGLSPMCLIHRIVHEIPRCLKIPNITNLISKSV